MYLDCSTPSGQSRVDWVTQLRTDGVYCRESTGTRPVVVKVLIVLVTGAAFAGHRGRMNVRPFSYTHHWHKVGILKVLEASEMY